jgi:Peptidase A4 family
MASFTTASGLTVDTFEVPPADFDLDSATPEDLARFGFAAFEDAPELRRRLNSRHRGYRFIAPTFGAEESRDAVLTDVSLSLPAAEAAAPPVGLPTWAGAAVPGSPTAPICWIQGGWTVPSIQVPPGIPGEYFAACPWVGIDGLNNATNILQVGCTARIAAGTVEYGFWWQWRPGDSQPINFPIAAGDAISATIKLVPGSNSSAAILLANDSKRARLNFGVTAAPGFPVAGVSAEWVVEFVQQLGHLADFGLLTFTTCAVGATSGASTDLRSATPLFMQDAYRNVLAASQITNPASVAVRFVRSA